MADSSQKSEKDQEVFCPHLGQVEDTDTAYCYPSPWNRCNCARPSTSVRLDHQGEFCLTAEHVHCAMFLKGAGAAMPAGIRMKQRTKRLSYASRRILLVSAGIIALLVLVIFAGKLFLPGIIAAGDGQAVALTRTHDAFTTQVGMLTAGAPATLIMATPTLADTLLTTTIIPTRRPILSLDAPIGPEQLIIHLVAEGDTLDLLARKNGTTVAAIQSVNYALRVPLWVGWLVVIPAERTNVDQLPKFDAYRVTDFIHVEDLAGQLGVEADLLKQYNSLVDQTILSPNEYVLVPYLEATPTPSP